MNRPQFLYFDLGKVLVNFDHERAVQQLANLTDCSNDKIRELVFNSNLQSQYERGEISTEQFCDHLRSATATNATDQQFCLAASDIFWPNDPMLELVRTVGQSSIPFGILSNTCQAHWDFILDQSYPIMNLFDLESATTVLSYDVGTAKPNSAIYEHAIEQAGVKPSQIFFVDDLLANVEGARKAGLDAVMFVGADRLAADLAERGLQGLSV